MKNTSSWILLSIIFVIVGIYIGRTENPSLNFSEVEVGFEQGHEDINKEALDQSADNLELEIALSTTSRGVRWAYWWKDFSPFEKLKYLNFKRPPGPLHVGIQSGHWKNSEVPLELEGLKRNGGGASGGGKQEVDTVLEISKRVKTLLEKEGILVDLLPATVPPDYYADAFVSIHADGNANSSVSGFKIASPQRDFSTKSVDLAEKIRNSYKKETNLSEDDNITRRMSAYYAFNWRRYEHAIHPMTPAVIVETGFMTSSVDRRIIVSNPDRAAAGIAQGILEFLALK